MHGGGFSGKAKFQRSAKAERLPREQLRQLGATVMRLRAAFLHAWACEEAERSDAATSVDEWLDKLQQLVPTPRLVAPLRDETGSKSSSKTPVDAAEKPPGEKQTPPAAREEPQAQEKRTTDVAPLEPAPIPAAAAAVGAAAPASTPSCLNEPVGMGEWLLESAGRDCQWRDVQSLAHIGESRYTFCEDEVQFSLNFGDQQGVSMMRRSSRVVIDFGAPSCWHTGEEPKRASFSECSPWADNDLGALLAEPGVFSWDDASPTSPYTTYSPPLNLM
ncbi:unnamed protein product [Phytophthora fragariaefolia]|uniref:Unnamed protein product n=1 Tax=Phytophthora fragariaefolia TaxID=1490495 RepID=A0A9W6XGT4_9STRA|nr:unnamed protein product [Phytophthora fragariaefolia]